MPIYRFILLVSFVLGANIYLSAQYGNRINSTFKISNVKDSLKELVPLDTSSKKKHIPRIATIRSAIIPGWGQAYNHEYWKIPIVWAAIGIPAYTFFYNNSYYKKTSYAYGIRYRQFVDPTYTTGVDKIDPQLKNLDLYSLEIYRNSFRKDRDYSVLWFLILWGVNVVDATIFAHLKDFDVSPDLSLHVTPSLNNMTGAPSVSLALVNKKREHKLSSLALKY